jgi:membrane associated rhomboid family serine protease
MADLIESEELALRLTPSRSRAEEQALVLASAGIAYRLVERDGTFALLVAARDAAAANEALAAFDADSAPEALPPAPDLGPSALGIGFAVVLAAFFVVAGPGEAATPSVWFRVGSASSELIRHGQWWRAVTMLTLHGDLLHIASNVVASLLFVSAVGRWLGTGLGALVTLVAAAAANVLVALSHGTPSVSVGASTATFAALGILAGLQLVRRVRGGARSWRAWLLPIGAGLALYAMTGASREVDWRAHLFGLGVGALAGAGVALSGVRAPGRLAQAALGTLALSALAGCWVLALR